jgi:hypothetical protein
MLRIFRKIGVFLAYAPLALLAGLLMGLLIALFCYLAEPSFVTHFFIAKTDVNTGGPSSLIRFVVGNAICFSLLGVVAFTLVASFSLLFLHPQEMRHQIANAGLMIGTCALGFCALSAFYVAMHGQGMAQFNLVIGKLLSIVDVHPFLMPIYIFYGAVSGVIVGVIIALMNMIREYRTGQGLCDHLVHGDSPLSKIFSLFYPVDGLKYVMVVVTVISFILELHFMTNDLLSKLFLFSFGSAMWAVAAGYVYEFLLTKLGKNSAFMKSFYDEISEDIYVLVVYASCIFVFYLWLPKSYDLTNLDIGMLAPPYFLYVLLAVYKCGKTKVAGHALPHHVVRVIFALVGFIYLSAFFVFYLIQTTSMNEILALWWQITIFSTSIVTFVGARLLLFYLKNETIEGSPIWLKAFQSIKFASGIYELLVSAAPEWNRYVKMEKSKIRKENQLKRRRGR